MALVHAIVIALGVVVSLAGGIYFIDDTDSSVDDAHRAAPVANIITIAPPQEHINLGPGGADFDIISQNPRAGTRVTYPGELCKTQDFMDHAIDNSTAAWFVDFFEKADPRPPRVQCAVMYNLPAHVLYMPRQKLLCVIDPTSAYRTVRYGETQTTRTIPGIEVVLPGDATDTVSVSVNGPCWSKSEDGVIAIDKTSILFQRPHSTIAFECFKWTDPDTAASMGYCR